MIELIFAIVVIAITVLSLPVMTQITSRGMERGLVQEAIFASSAEIQQALSYRWDRFSAPEDNNISYSKVINLHNDCDAITKKRPGHAARSCLNDLTIVAPHNASSTDVATIHDITGAKNLFIIAATDNGSGYKQQYQITLAINNPSSFGSLVNNDSIKRVSASVSDADGNLITQLYSYTFNIGEIEPIKRSF